MYRLVFLLISFTIACKTNRPILAPEASEVFCVCHNVDSLSSSKAIEILAGGISFRSQQNNLRRYFNFFQENDSINLASLKPMTIRLETDYNYLGCKKELQTGAPAALQKLDSCKLNLFEELSNVSSQAVYPIFKNALTLSEFNFIDSITRGFNVEVRVSVDPVLSSGYESCLRFSNGRAYNDTCAISSINW